MRDTAERDAALARANRIRMERATWKRQVRGLPEIQALRAAVALIAAPPEWALTWRLTEVLRTLPNVGATKLRRLMTGWAFRDQMRLGSMSDRQRRLVIEWALARAEARAAA